MKSTDCESPQAGQRKINAAAPHLFSCRSWTWLVWVLILVSGCLPASQDPAASPSRAVTQQVSQTSGPDATAAPVRLQTATPDQTAVTTRQPASLVHTQTATQSLPTAEDEASPTPDLKRWGNGAEDVIRMTAPGPGSQVASPFTAAIEYLSHNAERVWIELHGSDGRLLARQVLQTEQKGVTQQLVQEIPFDIRTPSEVVLLVASLKDRQGRALATTSTELQLNASGQAVLQEPWPNPGLQLQSPGPGEEIQGGSLTVSGLVHRPVNEPLRVQLIGQDGSLIAQRLAGVSREGRADYASFTTDIDYRVMRPTPAWLVIYQDGKPFIEVAQLITIPVVLLP